MTPPAHRHVLIGGRPRLLLGGQLHNSTSSDLDRARAAFDRVVAMGGNAVTATVSWHLVEPVEGSYDFSGVDPLVDMARERGLALTLLWFGAFKNAASTYAPRWVRADAERFPRADLGGAGGAGGGAFSRPGTPVLSVFAPALLDADRRAFAELTRHLAEVDGASTVVMVQVENETGLLGAARDHSAPARAAWEAEVPAALLDRLAECSDAVGRPGAAGAAGAAGTVGADGAVGTVGADDAAGAVGTAGMIDEPGSGDRPGAGGTAGRLWRERDRRARGTWAEVFGEDEWAQEVFMAWGFASYCGALAAAGARHLDVPFYVNAWLGPQPGQDLPGRYPSGGPVAGVVDVWKAAAPALALLGPDIYVDDVKAAVAGYVREDNALLVPESRPAVGNLLWAVGCGAIGFNVFGVDDVRADGRLAAAYRLLAGAEEVIIAAQRSGRIRPVLLEAGQTAVVGLGGLTWTLRGSGEVLRSMFLDAGVQVRTEAGAGEPETTDEALVAAPADTRAMAVLVDLGDDELLAIGQGLMFEVAGVPGEVVEIDDAVEGRYEAGVWVSGRNLNGDERLNLLPLDRPAAVRIRVLRRRG